jgi:hypothetical protein
MSTFDIFSTIGWVVDVIFSFLRIGLVLLVIYILPTILLALIGWLIIAGERIVSFIKFKTKKAGHRGESEKKENVTSTRSSENSGVSENLLTQQSETPNKSLQNVSRTSQASPDARGRRTSQSASDARGRRTSGARTEARGRRTSGAGSYVRDTRTTRAPSDATNPTKRTRRKSIENRVEEFEPIANVVFTISKSNYDYSWYALYYYYPVNRFRASELSVAQREARRHVYDFKDGLDPRYYARIFASALINQFGRNFCTGKILIVVPASDRIRTEARFEEFCLLLSTYTGLINGFEMFTNNELDRTPANAGGDRNADLEQFVDISDSLAGTHVVVVDDVRTSGSSSSQVYKMLKRRNVSSATFFYLAKTVSFY